MNPIVPLPDMKQQMVILATYADGATRDVTAQSFIESGDIERLDANSAGLITTRREGRCKFHYLETGPLNAIVKRWLTPPRSGAKQ